MNAVLLATYLLPLGGLSSPRFKFGIVNSSNLMTVGHLYALNAFYLSGSSNFNLPNSNQQSDDPRSNENSVNNIQNTSGSNVCNSNYN